MWKRRSRLLRGRSIRGGDNASSSSSTTTTTTVHRQNLSNQKKRTKLKHYEILGKLGNGSFAEVLLVKHLLTGDFNAMKVASLQDIEDAGTLLGLLRTEINIMKSLPAHENIVSLLATWEEKQPLKVYLVLTYVYGLDLYDVLTAKRRIPSALTARYVLQVAHALEHMHTHRVIFRDLKLENIMLDQRSNTAVLVDFGLAKMFGKQDPERTQTICGTTKYMAPEVLSGKEYSYSVDWWCLGVVAYLLMSGKYPFSAGIRNLANDNSSSDRAIVHRRITELSLSFTPLFDDPSQAVIRRLLEPSPSDRISSLSQLKWLKWFHEIDFAPEPFDPAEFNLEEPIEKPTRDPYKDFTGSYLKTLIDTNQPLQHPSQPSPTTTTTTATATINATTTTNAPSISHADASENAPARSLLQPPPFLAQTKHNGSTNSLLLMNIGPSFEDNENDGDEDDDVDAADDAVWDMPALSSLIDEITNEPPSQALT